MLPQNRKNRVGNSLIISQCCRSVVRKARQPPYLFCKVKVSRIQEVGVRRGWTKSGTLDIKIERSRIGPQVKSHKMRETNDERDQGKNFYTCPELEYEPTHFIKCHSRIKGDKNDRSTKVWMCAFEPHPIYAHQTTDLVATCGSNSVCVINVKSGDVIIKHYSSDSNEDFYSVSWSTVNMVEKEGGKKMQGNILAAAGTRCTVHLLHLSRQECFLQEKIRKPFGVSITSLLFHPLAKPLLCGSFSDGEVVLWDIGVPSIPDYDVTLLTVRTLSIKSEIHNLSFSRHCECMLAATDNGVVSWALNVRNTQDSKSKIKTWRINFPAKTGIQSHDSQLVDTVEPIENGKIIASKCALYGSIYLWDLEEVTTNCNSGGSVIIEPNHILNYSSTDNYFMSMGSSLMSCLLACGDDIGNIWLYNVKEALAESLMERDQSAIIPWPTVQDTFDHRMVKQPEVVINKVVVNFDGSYIVAVTSTNLVCIWKKD